VRLLFAILAISTGAPFARWAKPAPALAIAALRSTAAAVLFAIVGRRELAALRALPRRELALVALSGALLAVHFGAWIGSLEYTSTAASVALVCTNPIFAALFGVLLGDHPRRREWLGIAIAAGGCAVLAGGDWRAGGDAIVGDALALVGAASASAYLVVGRHLRRAAPLAPYMAAVNAIAASALLAVAIATGAPLAALEPHSYVACIGAAACASLVGHGLINAAVRTTPAHVVALAILAEPIGASLITWAAFDEAPPAHAALGGAIVIVGIAVGFARRGENA
jgi:drug/metabolite transporter (DMT)-like permease